MKKLYLTLSISIIFSFSNVFKAQSEIWGLNASGGDGLGVLYGMPAGATAITTQYNFLGSPGSNPQSMKLLQASNGKLYGMTNLGGINNVGIIFEYDTLTGAYSRKADFMGTNGANPKGSLIQAANGKLYGMTQFGGTNNLGVIFEYDITLNTYNVLVNFSGNAGLAPGSQPVGTLLQPDASSNKLYGLTRFGGANNLGVLFEYDYSTNVYTSKVDFVAATIGSNPLGQLVKAVSASSSSTTVYGLASSGGVNSVGTLFEYDYALNAMTKKFDFSPGTGGSGASPQGSLLLASNGRLYGTTLIGGTNNNGAIFEYIISSNTYNKLTNLVTGVGAIGGTPTGDLMEAANGKLYGLTRTGGSSNTGVVFEYDVTNPASPVYTKKIDLLAANGSLPFGTLMQVNTGKLYGVTSAGGAVNSGVIFQYSIGPNTYTKMVDLNLSTGGSPNGSLVQASNGKLYGLAAVGGTNNSVGVIFEYDRTNNTYTKKIDFSGNTGSNPGSTPFGSLMQASNSKLYGVTSAGGAGGVGTLFNYDPATGVYTKFIDFTGNTGPNLGGAPYGALAQYTGAGTANGKLYGMTKQGGTGLGVIFEFDPVTNVYIKKIDLIAANGYSAFGSLTESNNKFYGMTQLGGANSLGVIFEYDPSANVYTKKIDFTGTTGLAQGSLPFGSLVQTATVGVLYGMTKSGGANDLGVIFEYNATTNTYTKKYDMTSVNGSQPFGSLIRSANGKLYGVTNTGGANSAGVLFEYDIDNATYTKKMDFNFASGYFPTYTQLLEVCTKPLTPGLITSSTNTLCEADAGTKNFSITAVANATAYAWELPAGAAITSGSTTASINANLAGVAAGTYTYGVTGVNMCGTGTLSTGNLTVNALPAINVNSGSICAGAVFTITPGGAATYSVEGNSFMVTPSGNTSYTVLGESAEGCISANTATATVTVNALPVIGVNSGTICAGSAFTLSPTGVVTSTPSGGSLIVSPGTNTFYTIVGTDGNNCVSANTATAFVTIETVPVISINNATMCAGESVTLTPSGAGAGATYYVDSFSGAGPFVFSPGSSTGFTAAATSSFGCVSSNTPVAAVTVYTLPVISVNSPTMCFGQGAVISPSGAGASATYTVDVVNGAGPFNVNPAASTNYTVAGTNSLGCVSAGTATAAVTVYTLPVISVNSGTLCSGSIFTIIPGGALTYTMGPETGNVFTVTPVASTSYTIAGESPDGCISASPATANVTVFALPSLSVNSGAICLGGDFTITPSGGSSYTILPIGIPITTNLIIGAPLASTEFTVIGVNAQGCASAGIPVVSTLTVNPLPTVSALNGTICAGNVLTSTVNGAVSYTYAAASISHTVISSGSSTFSPASSVVYSVTGANTLGCKATIPMTIVVNALPVVAISGTNAICEGGTATLTASGANTYNWGTSTGTALVINPSVSTSYSVTGTNLNNCSNTASFSVTVNTLPVVTAPSGAVCTGNCYTLTPGGASTYTFSGTGGSNIVCPGATTDYSVVGTSTAGCVSPMAVVTVSVVNILTVSITGNTTVCQGGTITLTANGASSYNWSTGALTNTVAVSPSSSTSYTVMGTSGTCSDVAMVNVSVNLLPTISALSPRPEICLNESVELTASGGVSYLWSTVSTGVTVTVSPVITTSYSVIGTDANGCENSATVIVIVNACTGLSELAANGWQYVLYPNPNSGAFVIETSAQISATVVNALGQSILKQELNEGKNQINLNEQAKGIYFVQLKNGASTKIIKIVKQ